MKGALCARVESGRVVLCAACREGRPCTGDGWRETQLRRLASQDTDGPSLVAIFGRGREPQ